MNWLRIIRHNQQDRCIGFWGEISQKNNSLLCYVINVQGDACFIPVDITEEAVESVAQKKLESSGPGGTDSEEKVWLIKFG